jgi:8-oxo-dGTP diphosphatase
VTAYRNPKPTVDVVIRLPDDRIVLIRRKNPPYGWALPGGFVDEGEPLETAAVREAREETGLAVRLDEQFFTYSDPSRDPRQHTISTVYLAHAEGEATGGDDAAEARAFAWDDLPPLAFDHGAILGDVRRYLRTGARRRLPEETGAPGVLPDDDALARLLELARGAIAGGPAAVLAPVPAGGHAPAGLVVTLYDAAGAERGSVGTSEPRPLAAAAVELARRAAFQDPRFPPVTPAEHGGLAVELCVLGPARRVTGPDDLRPDDAVRIRKGLRTSLLLPGVARDRSWGAETFLVYACRQAGLPGEAYRDPDTVVEAFETRCRRAPLAPAA